MEKKYEYRKHLREPEKFLAALVLLFIITYVVLSSVLILTNDRMTLTNVIIFLVIGIIVLVLISLEFLVMYFVFFRRFKKINVILTKDSLVYTNIKRTDVIPFDEITSLKFPSIKYTGGWLKIIYKGGNIRLTVVLENIGDLLKTLKNHIDAAGKSDIYDERKMFKFYKTAQFSDNSWGRLYDYFKQFVMFIIINVLVGVLFSVLTKASENKADLIISAFILPIAAYFISEIIIGRKLAKGANLVNFYVPERDKHFEITVCKNVAIASSIMYLTLAIFFTLIR